MEDCDVNGPILGPHLRRECLVDGHGFTAVLAPQCSLF